MKESFLKKQFDVVQSTKDTISVKMTVAGVATILMSVLSIIRLHVIALAACSIIMSAVVYFICRHEFNDALISLFKMKPSNDTFNVLALIAVVIRAISLFFTEDATAYFFCPILFASITVSMIMKLLFASDIDENIKMLRRRKPYLVHTAKLNLRNKTIDNACMVSPAESSPDIVNITYSDDPSEAKSKFFIPVITVIIIIISIILLFLKGTTAFFTALSSLFIICASFTGEMAFVLPYVVAQTRLRRMGSMLLGYQSVEELKDVDTLLLTDVELFPQRLARLEKVKFLNKPYMSKAIEYTATLMKETHSPIKEAFWDVLGFSDEKLAEVEHIKSIKNQGISAIMEGNHVLLGNRALLHANNVSPYSSEKEASMATANGSIIYCAINGELAAILMVQYINDPEIKRSAEHVGGDFNIVVETEDCNVNENMIKKQYDMPNTKIIVPNNEETKQIEELRAKLAKTPQTPVMISSEKAIGILASVRHAKMLYETINFSILIKHISIVLGITLSTVAFFLSPGSVSSFWLLIFNIIWSIPIFIVSFLKNK